MGETAAQEDARVDVGAASIMDRNFSMKSARSEFLEMKGIVRVLSDYILKNEA